MGIGPPDEAKRIALLPSDAVMPGANPPEGSEMETTVRAPRPEKVAVVNEVRDKFTAADAAILTEYRGLAVKDMKVLRRALTAVGGDYKVYKNTLVRRAAHEIGFEALESMLTGPTAIAFVDGDVAQVAKVLRDFARTNPNLVVKGGLLGTNLLDATSAAALADLPSRDALLAQIAGMLAAPMQQFAALLKAVPSKFAYALSALIDERRESEPAPEPIPEAAPAEAIASAESAAEVVDVQADVVAESAPEAEDAATEAPAPEAVEDAATEAPPADAEVATEVLAEAEAEAVSEPEAEPAAAADDAAESATDQ